MTSKPNRILNDTEKTTLNIILQVDLQTFLSLTDGDLKELGITTFGPRRKMLLAIQGKHQTDLFSTKPLKTV
jgi:hypothetical protein